MKTLPASMPDTCALLVNSGSRRGEAWFEQAKVGLTDRGMRIRTALLAHSVEELIAQLDAELAHGTPLVAVGGGDGTFSAVASRLLHRETVLGVLPLGTGNAFARDLGIPADVDRAVDTIVSGRVGTVDVGNVNGNPFLNVATVGVTTQIARMLTKPMKRKFGRAVYAIAATRALMRAEPFRLRIDNEHGRIELETLQLVIGNGRFHAGPFPLAPHASITEGNLSLYALAATNVGALMRLFLHLPAGRHIDLPEVLYQDTERGKITTEPLKRATLDGEVSMKTPFEYGILPDCLRVAVPADFPR